MDGTFIEALEKGLREPIVLPVDGRPRLCLPPNWSAKAVEPPQPPTLEVTTLRSVVEYIRTNRDALDLARCLLHVDSPQNVTLRGPLMPSPEVVQRHAYIEASAQDFAASVTDRWVDVEEFLVAVMTRFGPEGDAPGLLKLVGSITSAKVQDTVDNGYSQKVTVQQGVALVGEVAVRNPMTLYPHASFPDIELAPAKYILRLRDGAGSRPQLCLFSAEDGNWTLAVRARIAQWLLKELGTTSTLVVLW